MSDRNQKPPLGVEPECLWHEKRIVSLAEGLVRYSETGLSGERLGSMITWADELQDHLMRVALLKGRKHE